MKVRMAVLVSLFVCLFFVNQSSVSAAYVVERGDTLWTLSGAKIGDPEQWRHIYAANPFLQEGGRLSQKEDGTIVVILKPGESLEGLDELGITPTLVPFSELTRPEPQVMQAPTPAELEEVSFFSWWWIFWAVVLVLAGMAVWVFYQLRRDPITSGRPAVVGGVTPENFEASATQAAARVTNYRSRGDVRSNHLTVVGRRIGRCNGVTESFFDGMTHPRIRNYNGEVGYQFDVRFPDGHVEQFHMAEGCGNAIYSGLLTRHITRRGFTFTPMSAEEEAAYYRSRGLAPASAPAAQAVVQQVAVSAEPPAPASASGPEVVQSDAAPAVVAVTGVAPETEAPAVLAASTPAVQAEDGVVEIKFSSPFGENENHSIEISGVDVNNFQFRKQKDKTIFRFRPVPAS